MTEIISVRFKPGGKVYDFDPRDLKVTPGTGVIVETSRGEEYGECVRGNTTVEDMRVTQPLRPVVRIADRRDRETAERNREKEAEAFSFCRERIEALGLEMKLVKVEYSFDGSKVVCFFTAENRVDFRQLVRELASRLHARIELRQIGVRDEAKMLGGLGICGKPFCCSQFLEEFHPVSIKMAKTQNISLNPTKISGTCGRLMCCLKYEQEAYEDAVKRCPREESFVECPEGVGTVSGVNLLRETAKVQLEDSTEAPKTFHISELRVVRSGKGKLLISSSFSAAGHMNHGLAAGDKGQGFFAACVGFEDGSQETPGLSGFAIELICQQNRFIAQLAAMLCRSSAESFHGTDNMIGCVCQFLGGFGLKHLPGLRRQIQIVLFRDGNRLLAGAGIRGGGARGDHIHRIAQNIGKNDGIDLCRSTVQGKTSAFNSRQPLADGIDLHNIRTAGQQVFIDVIQFLRSDQRRFKQSAAAPGQKEQDRICFAQIAGHP